MTIRSRRSCIRDVERRMYECPARGALCRLHQYERRFYLHTRCSMMATVIEACIPKLRCETCDGCPQIPVPWTRLRVSYMRMLEREFFTLLSEFVNRTR